MINRKHRRASGAKPGAWFIAVRGSYLPNSWQGWLTYIPFATYLVWALSYAWQHTGTLSRALLLIVPNWVAAAVVMTWLAKYTS
jgi:hypothetical protein